MKMIDYIKEKKRNVEAMRVLRHDVNEYKDYYSTSSWANNNGNKEARDILVFCHVVEKGLSHRNIKPLFGYDRVSLISSSLKGYLAKGGNDEFIIDIAISTLKHYNEVNMKLGVSSEKLVPVPSIDHYREIGIGVNSVSEDEYYSYSSIDLFGNLEIGDKKRYDGRG